MTASPVPAAPSRSKWSASIEAFVDGRRRGLILLKVSCIDQQLFPTEYLQQPQALAEIVLPGEPLSLCPMGAKFHDRQLVLSFYSSLLTATGSLPRTVCLILEAAVFKRFSASVPVKLIRDAPEMDVVAEKSRPVVRPLRAVAKDEGFRWRKPESVTEDSTETTWPVPLLSAGLATAAAYSLTVAAHEPRERFPVAAKP